MTHWQFRMQTCCLPQLVDQLSWSSWVGVDREVPWTTLRQPYPSGPWSPHGERLVNVWSKIGWGLSQQVAAGMTGECGGSLSGLGVLGLDRPIRLEHIARAAHREDVLRIAGVSLQLGAQPIDELLHQLVRADVLRAPGIGQDGVRAEHLTLVFH